MTGFVSNGPAFGAGQTRDAADLGDLVATDIYTLAGIETAFPAAGLTDAARGLVGTAESGDFVMAYVDSGAWYAQAHMPLGDMSAPPTGRIVGDLGVDDNGILRRWSKSTVGTSGGFWFRACPFATSRLFVPTAHYAIIEEDPADPPWSITEASGGGISYSGGKVLVAGGSASGSSYALAGSPAAPAFQAVAFRGASVSGASGTGASANFGLIETGSKYGITAQVNPGVNATNWVFPTSTTPFNSGVAFGSSQDFEVYRLGGQIAVYLVGTAAAVYSSASYVGAATGVANAALVQASYVASQPTFSFDEFHTATE